ALERGVAARRDAQVAARLERTRDGLARGGAFARVAALETGLHRLAAAVGVAAEFAAHVETIARRFARVARGVERHVAAGLDAGVAAGLEIRAFETRIVLRLDREL